jgi:hypothetical protein
MFVDNILEEVKQAYHRATASSHQLDWYWVGRYRELDAFDAYRGGCKLVRSMEKNDDSGRHCRCSSPDEDTKDALSLNLVGASC